MITSSQNQLDQMIYNIFGKDKVFFEAGGSNPFDQSNTTFLEEKGWSGLVVEPKVLWNDVYKNHRPKTILENYVLVSSQYKDNYIEGDFSDFMTGGVINIHNKIKWSPTKLPCTTLDFLFEKHKINEIHFFSLDVEGYEKQVLEGVNFEKIFIHSMLIESHQINGKWTNFDYLKDFGFDKLLEIKNHTLFFNKKSKFNFNVYSEKNCFDKTWKKL